MLHWVFIVIYGLLTAGVSITVLMDNRQPAKAMAWILVLTFMPIVGIVLFFFFGQNTRKKRRISHLIEARNMPGLPQPAEEHDLIPVPRVEADNKQSTPTTLQLLFLNQGGTLPVSAEGTEVYTSGSDFFLALLQAFGRAQHSIRLSTYIFADDALGRLVADALCDQARRGVSVYVIYDGVGSWKVKSKFFERMEKAGINVVAFMPVHFPALTSKMNYRNHRKLCIIDGQEAFIGGMNIALRYVNAWRDTHMYVRGSVVESMERAFVIADSTLPFNNSTARPTGTLSERSGERIQQFNTSTLQQFTPSAINAQFVMSAPTSPWADIMQGYVHILLNARHYVYMETPYFLPTEPILFAMRTAALSGVDVRLMVPLHGDSRLTEWASRSYVAETTQAGVKVFLYTGRFNHSKFLVSDDSLATCGSTNIDFRSFENNFEANLFLYNQEIALRFKEIFFDDLNNCMTFDDYRARHKHHFLQRLWESMVRLLAPLL